MRTPGAIEKDRLGTGEVGYLVAGVKNVLDARVGDTITSAKDCEGIKRLCRVCLTSVRARIM